MNTSFICTWCLYISTYYAYILCAEISVCVCVSTDAGKKRQWERKEDCFRFWDLHNITLRLSYTGTWWCYRSFYRAAQFLFLHSHLGIARSHFSFDCVYLYYTQMPLTQTFMYYHHRIHIYYYVCGMICSVIVHCVNVERLVDMCMCHRHIMCMCVLEFNSFYIEHVRDKLFIYLYFVSVHNTNAVQKALPVKTQHAPIKWTVCIHSESHCKEWLSHWRALTTNSMDRQTEVQRERVGERKREKEWEGKREREG